MLQLTFPRVGDRIISLLDLGYYWVHWQLFSGSAYLAVYDVQRHSVLILYRLDAGVLIIYGLDYLRLGTSLERRTVEYFDEVCFSLPFPE